MRAIGKIPVSQSFLDKNHHFSVAHFICRSQGKGVSVPVIEEERKILSDACRTKKLTAKKRAEQPKGGATSPFIWASDEATR